MSATCEVARPAVVADAHMVAEEAQCPPEPFFSVVVPLYNKEAYIARALDSVLAQSFADFELIVVDDGSTDAGADVAADFAQRDSRVRLVRQANAGVSAARNCGIARARGRYVAFLDADDEWENAHLQQLAGLAGAYPQAMMLFDRVAVRKRGRLRADAWLGQSALPETGLLESYPQAMVSSPNVIHSSNVAISRRALLAQERCFDERETIGEDLELWLRMAAQHPVAYCTRLGAIYDHDTGANNTRSMQAVHCPRGYFATIERLMVCERMSEADRAALAHVRDRKMVADVFSLACAGRKAEARDVLAGWQPRGRYAKYKPALRIAAALPRGCAQFVGALRMKVV